MRLVTLFGTRPEIIRLSRVIATLDGHCEQVLVHTGQNYAPNLSDLFFDELEVRRPDIHLGVKAATFSEQAAQILERTGRTLREVAPDRLLVLGDTNSGLAAINAARMGIPVYHMEAGNRCFDDRVPEEINRRVIDHCSSILMPYTQRSMENLLREGIERDRIFVTGNPILEVLDFFEASIQASDIHHRLEVASDEYFLVTMHRAENVDLPDRLASLLTGLSRVSTSFNLPTVVSVHPRTADKMKHFGLKPGTDQLRLVEPLGFFDFVRLEKDARAVISDSGTVQEECAIFNVPNVTIRDVTERPETIECGSNMLSGSDPDALQLALETVLETSRQWRPPAEYLARDVSRTVAKVVLGHLGPIGRLRFSTRRPVS